MNVTETNADGLTREFTIVVPAGELEDRIVARLGELSRTINLPGFRPGKVPIQILRRRYGPAVRGEVLESTLQGGSAEAIRDHKLRPALPPKVEIVSCEEGADLEYKMLVELLPDMPALDFSDLGLERLIAEVPDSDIETAVARLAERQRKAEPVERPAALGDVVAVDLVGRIGTEEIPGSRGENRQIELGAGSFIPGFEDQLVGADAGEERVVRVTFPEGYGNTELAGKEAEFTVMVKQVLERQPAAIDDTLAQAVGLETMTELRQEIRQGMQSDFNALTRQHLKGALLDKLAERYHFPVPPGMLEIEFNSIWQQYEAEKARQAQAAAPAALEPPPAEPSTPEAEAAAEPEAASAPTPEAAAPAPESAPAEGEAAVAAAADAAPSDGEEATRAEYRDIAERRVRLGLLLAEVGRSNNISVTDEELNQALTREARRHPGYERQVLDYYRKNPEAVGGLRAPIFEDKVVDFIIELAKVAERTVSPQELIGAGGEAAEGGTAEGEAAGSKAAEGEAAAQD